MNLRKGKGNDFIFDLVNKFNQANGIFDIRTADSFNAIFRKKRELAHTIKNDTISMGTNATKALKIRDFDNIQIRPQTKAKFQKWLETAPDSKAIENIYFDLKEFIQNPASKYEVETINGRTEIVKKEIEQKEQSQIKPFAEVWNELTENLLTESENKEFLKLSILNVEETEAMQISKDFYRDWKQFNKVKTYVPIRTLNHFKEDIKENNHSLFEMKKGA